MPHSEKEKQKLVNRMRRIRGQIDAIQRVLEEDGTCLAILQQSSACRGALMLPSSLRREGNAMSKSREFAAFVAGLRYEDLPAAVVDRADT